MRIKLFSLLTVVFLSTSLFAKATGEELFKECKACHMLSEDRLIGPGLAGVTERRSKEWLKSWITSSTKFIATGDADAVALFDEYKIPMADYNFSDEDMETLLAYLAGEETEVVVAEPVAEETKVEDVKTEEVVVVEESDWSKALSNRPLTKWLFGLSIFLLLGVLIAAIKIYRTSKEA